MGKDKRKRSESPKRDKKKKKKEKKDSENSVFGYSNDSNPFNDTNITSRFVWKKKVEQEIEKGRDPSEFSSKAEKKRIQALASDLEKAKARRVVREREKQLWEEEMARLERERNHSLQHDWENKEAQFHLEQARKRSEIRIKEGRMKAIDIIYKNLNHDPSFDFQMNQPFLIFHDLPLAELKELKDEILVYLELDKEENKEFWNSMLIVCNAELEKHLPSSLPASDEIYNEYLKDRSYDELIELENEAKETIERGGAIDVEFWEQVIKETQVAKAKAKLRQIHSSLLSKRLASFSSRPSSSSSSSRNHHHHHDDNHNNHHHHHHEDGNNNNNNNNNEASQQSSSSSSAVVTALSEDSLLKYESEKGLAENEEVFIGEVDLGDVKYAWRHLYRPRKPKYYNRVKSGYEWNKYNQTHYDHDNPPPKIIQGYKFNIFYPDLIDKTKAPSFTVDKTDGDTTIIRFSASAPYSDIAFRIVNRDWELSHKKGYKCVFDKGTLHLWFNFKRYRYRR